jgi:hypothetical protein
MTRRFAAGLRWSLLGFLWGSLVTAHADNRISIPVQINGQRVHFVFDTGASAIFLYRSAADRLKLRITPPPTGLTPKPGEVLPGRSEPVTLEILGRIFPSIPLAVLDNPPQPLDFDGAVGWPNLRKSLMAFHGPTLSFEPLRVVPATMGGWAKLAERTDWNLLSLRLPGDGSNVPAYLGLDTGNPDGVFLSPEAWSRWRGEHANQPTTLLAYFMPGAGLVDTEVMWADELDLQGVTFHGVPVSCMNTSEVSDYPPGTLAVIGLAALRRMELVFDGNATVYARTLATPPPPYVHNRLGAVFLPDVTGNDALVAHVIADSPAGQAGLRFGDILLKIDQLDVTPWRTQPGILPLSRFWQQPGGTHLHLTVLRGKKKLTLDVVLRNLLGPEEK